MWSSLTPARGSASFGESPRRHVQHPNPNHQDEQDVIEFAHAESAKACFT